MSAARESGSALVRVAYQGEPGAFGEEAVATRWGARAESVPVATFDDVVAAVRAGRVAYGLLPVENSIAGPVTVALAALDAAGGLATSRHAGAVRAVDEVRLPIRQCLLALPGATLDDLDTVESHPVALAQCARFLQHRPWLRARAVHDTAGAARLVAESGDRRRGAIASRQAAMRHGLAVLLAGVQDRADNVTRFLVVTAAAGEARAESAA